VPINHLVAIIACYIPGDIGAFNWAGASLGASVDTWSRPDKTGKTGGGERWRRKGGQSPL